MKRTLKTFIMLTIVGIAGVVSAIALTNPETKLRPAGNEYPMPSNDPGLDRVGSDGSTYGGVKFVGESAYMPDYVKAEIDGIKGYVSRADLNPQPPFMPDGTPTGASTKITLRDINGKVLKVIDRSDMWKSQTTRPVETKETRPPVK